MTPREFDLLAEVAAHERRRTREEARRAFALLAKAMLWPSPPGGPCP